MRCAYIDARENIILAGNPGTGKSHLATALMEARKERVLARMKSYLAKLDLLILDELRGTSLRCDQQRLRR